MKKIFTLLLAFAAASASFAEMKWGVDAGYDHNWLISSSSLQITSSDGQTVYEQKSSKATLNLDGFHVSAMFGYNIEAIPGLFLNAGLGYQFATGAVRPDQVSSLIFDLNKDISVEIEKCSKITYKMHNLQMPIRIGYEYTFDNGVGVMVQAGPLLNFGLDWQLIGETATGYVATLHQLSGKFVGKQGDNATTRRDSDWAHYNVFDIALGGSVGVSYKWVYFNIGCDAGLLNICKHPSYTMNIDGKRYDTDNTSRNVQLKMSVGARF
ncbi:MAG: outer membrane beta-barrel protein [Paludibacteraceae bacterium]|nr:outer membrane beta-barrel protein [Paludibacteraceae bacterium]